MTAAACVALSVLNALGLLARQPAWFYPVVITAGLAVAVLGERLSEPGRTSTLRIVGQVVSVTAIIYGAGWGSALGIGYLFIVAENIRTHGSRVARTATVCALAGLALGEIAVAAGVAPTLINEALAHGLAVLVGLGLVFVAILLHQASSAGEQGLEMMRASVESLQRQATYDVLTGLPNGKALLQRIDDVLGTSGTPASLLVIDIDGMRHVNDALGFTAGDEVLKELARRLGEVTGFIARLDGDAFAVFLERDEADARAIAYDAQALLREPFVIDGERVHLGASLGLAVRTESEDATRLLRSANDALAAAKRRGGDRVEKADPNGDTVVVGRLRLASELRTTLERGLLDVAYQPIVDVRSGHVVAAEALARWNHPRGIVPPDIFIPIAEDAGLISVLGESVLATAAAQAAQWGGLPVSVNVSARQLLDTQFPARVEMLLTIAGLDPTALTVELTETVLVEDCEETNDVLRALTDMGVRLAIDDFGAGFAGFQYLQRFNTSQIKIDRSLIDHLDARPKRAALVRGLIEMARSLDVAVVAEGVEREAERDLLSAFGCELAQGWLFGRPHPAMQFPVPARQSVSGRK